MRRKNMRRGIIVLALVWTLLCASCALAQTAQLPAALLRIVDEAFMGNTSLENVILPEKLTAIGARAFADCANMETIYIPASVTEIADDAFEGCEALTFKCSWGSYAAVFAAKHIAQYPGCSVEMLGEMPQDVSVSLSVSRLMCEGSEIDLVWEVTPSIFQSGDLCELVVMLSGEEYKRFEKSSSLRYELKESHETPVTGEMYAVCYYEHADGTTSQAISEKTQLVGGMSAELSATDKMANLREFANWELSVQGAAGTPVVQYTLYKDGEVYAQSGYVTDMQYRAEMTQAGMYTAEASVTDGLGRTTTVRSAEVKVLTSTHSGDPLSYRLSDDGTYYIVTGCNIEAISADVPEKRNNLYVREIADGAFMACEKLERVYLHQNITKIGSYAFHGCTNLTRVDYMYLGGAEGTYSDCPKLQSLSMNPMTEIPAHFAEGCASVTSLSLPSATVIGERAFADCKGLTALEIPDTVKEIKRSAFSGCTGLQSITFGTGLEKIGENAFSGCEALTSLSLPEGVTEIEDSAFAGCSMLKEITFPASLEKIGERVFTACTMLKEVVLPQTVSAVENSAFAGCTALETVLFENIDTAIAQRAFDYCSNVELRTFGSGSVERFANERGIDFRNTALPEISAAGAASGEPSVGSSMTWYVQAGWGTAPYTYCFTVYCDGDKQAYSGETAESTFRHIPEIEGMYHAEVEVTDAAGLSASFVTPDIEVKPGVEGTLDKLRYEKNSAGTAYTITGCKNTGSDLFELVIPEMIDGLPVTSIKAKAFQSYGVNDPGRRLSAISIPDSVTEIGEFAFDGCISLKRIALPANLSVVGGYVFRDCTALEELIIPYGVKTLGRGMFFRCSSLKSVNVPSSVTSCGSSVFLNCSGIVDVVWNAAVEYFPDDAFALCGNLRRIVINYPITAIGFGAFSNTAIEMLSGRLERVTRVGYQAFLECKELKNLEFPAEVERFVIGTEAFDGCTSLESVRLWKKAECSVASRAFRNAVNLEELVCASVDLGGYLLDSYGRCLYFDHFKNCSKLKEITIRDCHVFESSFEGCTSLETVNIEGTEYIFDKAFKNCTSLKNLKFTTHRGFLHLYSEAFMNCTSLEEIVMPDFSSFRIGTSVFEGCTGLKRVEWGPRYINNKTFKNCTSLKTFEGMGNIIDIGDETFKNCIALENFVLEDYEYYSRSIGEEAFANCESLTHLDMSRLSYEEIADNAFVGCVNLTVTTPEKGYTHDYFAAHPEFGGTVADTLTTELSADVTWGEIKRDADGPYVTAKVTAYNTRGGTMIYAGDWASTLAAAKMTNAQVTVSSPCLSVQYEGDSFVMPPDSDARQVYTLGEINYLGAKSATVILRCTSEHPAKCDHGDLSVTVTADGNLKATATSAADVVFPNEVTGDLVIEEDTVFDVNTNVSGDVYVHALAALEGVKLSAGGDIRVCEGGTISMKKNASLHADTLDIQPGGAVDMNGGASIYADDVQDAGSLAVLSGACIVMADVFSVNGSGVLNMAADGRITTDSFIFDTSADHRSLLTNGTITAPDAQMKRGYHASGKHAFVLRGGECSLHVEKTSPKQHFAALTIDCKIGDLTATGADGLLGPVFECDHFGLSDSSIREEMDKGNAVSQEIIDKFIDAKLEAAAKAEEKMAKELEGWYDVALDMSDLDNDTLKEAQLAVTYAKKAAMNWMIETAASAPAKWSSVNDVIQAITSTHAGGSYTFKNGDKTYEMTVKPYGGLSATAAAAGWGKIECRCGSAKYDFVFSLNPDGIKKSGEALMTIMRRYARDGYVDQMNKALQEAVGKENAKYALALAKVIETSVIEEKTIMEVIAEKYGKDIAKKLIVEQFPKLKKTVDFVTKWDKFIKKSKSVTGMVAETREGSELPTTLMKEFLDLVKMAM